MKEVNLNKLIEISASTEKGLFASPYKYMGTALIVGAIATALFTVFPPLAIPMWVIAGWLLWSSAIILANRAAEGTSFIDRPIHFLHALTMEINSGIAACFLFPLTLFDQYHQPKRGLAGRPILMLNGYLSFGSTWHYLRNNLAKEGLGPIYTMNVGSFRSIKTYAEYVKEKVKEIQNETQRKDIDLICHSKGGLVGSYFATTLAQEIDAQVKNVITIGSPLGGTATAYLGLGLDAKEMRPNSPFIQELNQKILNHRGTEFYHIASETDRIVSHASALFGENKINHMRIKDAGHLHLIFCSRVSDQICCWLQPKDKEII